MTPFAVLVLYPLWALSLATGLVALRLGRAARGGLVVLSMSLAVWVTGLVLLESGAELAERVLPVGILLAGGVVHAGQDVARVKAPRALAAAYAFSGAVATLGAVAPRLLYGPGARSPGPLFLPVAAVATLGTLAVLGYLARLACHAQDALDRRRRLAVLLACLCGAPGGGGVIVLRVYGVADVAFAAPFLLVAITLVAYGVFSGEHGRARDVLSQGALQTFVTALLSAVGLTAFFHVLPWLTPGRGAEVGWVVLVVFLAALPLEPLRMLVVERVGSTLFRRPTTVPALAREVEATETRADHAERLAELGRVVSAVAHEVRNPLGIIAAQAKVLEKRGADPDAVAALREQVRRARDFLDDLLRYGKPRPLEMRSVEIAPLVALSASNARQAFGEGAPEVHVDAADGLRIEADRGALLDVLTNLLSNACIAAAGSGAPVVVRVHEEESGVVLEVEDRGPGVPHELEATLFAPFVTGRGRDARHPGTGLGLAIADRWVERHGGTLRHERPQSGGARFVVRLPRTPS